MTVDFDREELALLIQTLERHIVTIQDELAHTESFAMQRGLRQDFDRVERLLTKIREGTTRYASQGAAVPM